MRYIVLVLCASVFLSIHGYSQNFALNFTSAQWLQNTITGPLHSLTDNYTFECWVKWDGANAASSKFIFVNGNPSTHGQALFIAATTQEIRILYGGSIDFGTGAFLAPNVSTHLALVRNAGVSTVYVNGVAAPNSTATPPIATIGSNVFQIGLAGGTGSFSGQIDLFRAWSTALSPATITTWMGTQVITGHPNFGNLIANYPMNEGTGQTTASVGGSNPTTLLLGSTPSVDSADPTWVLSVFPAPTVTEWGMIIMAFSLVGVALWKLPISSLSRA